MTQPTIIKDLEPYHAEWLKFHPNRSEEWLRSMFREGFDVHHIDGDHGNSDWI